jgi:hypothetical protein
MAAQRVRRRSLLASPSGLFAVNHASRVASRYCLLIVSSRPRSGAPLQVLAVAGSFLCIR